MQAKVYKKRWWTVLEMKGRIRYNWLPILFCFLKTKSSRWIFNVHFQNDIAANQRLAFISEVFLIFFHGLVLGISILCTAIHSHLCLQIGNLSGIKILHFPQCGHENVDQVLDKGLNWGSTTWRKRCSVTYFSFCCTKIERKGKY